MKKTKEEINFGKENTVIRTPGKIGDRYTKVKQIGEGSFGKVFRVKHKITKEYRACKVIAKEKIVDIGKFNTEIAIMTKCDHPNIIKLYEIYENKTHIKLVMDECRGGELFDRIIDKYDKGEMFTEKEAATIFKEIMAGIAYCHSQGICHRDLKPENILFVNNEPNSPIKIIDFGLSKIFEEQHFAPTTTMTKGDKKEKIVMKSKVGTAYYMSPEVLQGYYDEKCDIWSAGVILYMMLSGNPPFNGANTNDIFRAILKKKFAFPEDEWKNVSDDVKDLIKKMLCEPEKRYNGEMVLGHTWIEKNAPNSSGNLATLNLNGLKSYVHSCKLKKMAILFMASRLSDEEVAELKKIFEEFDNNKDGTISLEELKLGIEKLEEKGIQASKGSKSERLFRCLDTDHSGRIDYTEFLAAMMEQKVYMQEEKLREAFSMFDSDNSGKISKNELLATIKQDNISDSHIEKYIEQFDLNKDGEIDYTEFVKMMEEEYRKGKEKDGK